MKISKSQTLPILPLLDGLVLLPGLYVRVNTKNNAGALALVGELLRSKQNLPTAAPDVAAVPLLPPPNTTTAGFTASPSSSTSAAGGGAEKTSSDDHEERYSIDVDRLHSIGTAARVLELVRSPTDNNNWILVLEGRCRVKIRDISTIGNSEQMYIAKVKQLDYFGAGPHARDASSADLTASGGGSHSNLSTKEEIEIQRQILVGIRSMFDAAAPGPRKELGTRTMQILKNYGPALTSDLVGSLVAQTTQQRISLLSTTDVATRLKMVDALLQHRLTAVASSSSSSSSSSPPSSAHATRGSSSSGGNETNDNADEDAVHQPLEAVIAKLKAAHTPSTEILDAAVREYHKLKRMNEQNPGYAAGLTYLETLADLPTPSSSSSSSSPNHHRRQFLQLAAVRARLDAHHFGLDKVKERIVQFVAVQNLRGWEKLSAATTTDNTGSGTLLASSAAEVEEQQGRAPVLCLIGPPGTGKTSIAKSMAAALQRPFQRISLGGVRDEAEIRGHRRTYVGALPGRIIAALRRAGSLEAVLLLDEVDKTGRDARGDPAAALLEALDPEQNRAFVDTYLGVPVDLSNIVFIATANTVAEIPPALLDRMEVLNLSGYTADEKEGIAGRHLVPKTLSEHGITADQVLFPRPALHLLVQGYTREAGVRHLERCLAAICRHVAVQLVMQREEQMAAALVAAAETEALSSSTNNSNEKEDGGGGGGELIMNAPPPTLLSLLGPGSMGLLNTTTTATTTTTTTTTPPIIVDEALISEVLGPRRYLGPDAAHHVSSPGAAAGLVWTPAGGAVQYIECLMVGNNNHDNNKHPNTGGGGGAAPRSTAAPGVLTLTGQLGDVLEESAKIALSWVRGHSQQLGLVSSPSSTEEENGDGGDDLANCPARWWDVHIHLPAGGVPKDGPSAGVTLAVALLSLFTGRCVRADTAFTGELTLRGLVLPVGGVKEKVLAAIAAGMQRVVLPSRNVAEVEREVPEEVRRGISLIRAERMEQVLAAAFDPPMELRKIVGGVVEEESPYYAVAKL